MGYAGHPCVRTPHLDMLAKESMVFSNAYVDCPICIPARTTLVTGIEAHHYGCPSFSPAFRINRSPQKFLGSLLTAAGYQTCLVGKSHWHTEASFSGGFEQWTTWNRWERQLHRALPWRPSPGIGVNELSPALSPLPPEWQKSAWAVTESIDFLQDRDQSRPFCLWLSLVDPHPPNVIHEPYFSLYDNDAIPEPVVPEWVKGDRPPVAIQRLRIGNDHGSPTRAAIRKARSVYYGMITHIDHQLGRLFGELMRQGLWNDTAVIYSSDHGEQLFDHGFCFKGNFLDPSARVPLLARLPQSMEAPRGQASRALVQWADILPTLCELAQTSSPSDIDGKSILPILRGASQSIRSYLHGQIGNQHMYHDGRYKYLYFADDGRELLFDKTTDLLDEHDLSADSAILEELRKRFIIHLREEANPCLDPQGILLNRHDTLTEQDRSNCIGWMGLNAAN